MMPTVFGDPKSRFEYKTFKTLIQLKVWLRPAELSLLDYITFQQFETLFLNKTWNVATLGAVTRERLLNYLTIDKGVSFLSKDQLFTQQYLASHLESEGNLNEPLFCLMRLGINTKSEVINHSYCQLFQKIRSKAALLGGDPYHILYVILQELQQINCLPTVGNEDVESQKVLCSLAEMYQWSPSMES